MDFVEIDDTHFKHEDSSGNVFHHYEYMEEYKLAIMTWNGFLLGVGHYLYFSKKKYILSQKRRDEIRRRTSSTKDFFRKI